MIKHDGFPFEEILFEVKALIIFNFKAAEALEYAVDPPHHLRLEVKYPYY